MPRRSLISRTLLFPLSVISPHFLLTLLKTSLLASDPHAWLLPPTFQSFVVSSRLFFFLRSDSFPPSGWSVFSHSSAERPIPLKPSQSLLLQLDSPLRQTGSQGRKDCLRGMKLAPSLSPPPLLSLSWPTLFVRTEGMQSTSLSGLPKPRPALLLLLRSCHFFSPFVHLWRIGSYTCSPLSSIDSVMEWPLQLHSG